jgi:hypothetical protein
MNLPSAPLRKSVTHKKVIAFPTHKLKESHVSVRAFVYSYVNRAGQTFDRTSFLAPFAPLHFNLYNSLSLYVSRIDEMSW